MGLGFRIVLVLALAVSPALADVKAHLTKAKAHFDLQEYADAEKELKEAYRMDPKPEVLYGIAQAQRMGGACERAIVTYKTYLRGNPPAAQRKLAEDNIATCEATLKTAVKPPDKPVNPPDKPDKPDNPDKPPDKPDKTDQPDKPVKPAEITVTVGKPWYKNGIGHAFMLSGAGAITGGVLLAMYGEKKIDRINNTAFYDDFVERSADASTAKTLRMIGLIGVGAGAASIGISLIIYKVRSPRTERRPAPTILIDARGVSVAWER
jgi:tetratricopeptide (TPR) repeat protein